MTCSVCVCVNERDTDREQVHAPVFGTDVCFAGIVSGFLVAEGGFDGNFFLPPLVFR